MNATLEPLAQELVHRLDLPANIALMHLLLRARSPDHASAAIAAALADCEQRGDRNGAARLRDIAQLWHRHPDAFAVVQGAAFNHARPSGPSTDIMRDWAARFDRLGSLAPEGGVALYSLGSPDLLAAATGEIVSYVRSRRLLGRECTVLDNGCGIGRVTAALAPEVGHVTGIDISAEMVRVAQERCGHLVNAEFAQCSGTDLAGFADSSFDLVLAVDVFPYLVLSGTDLVRRQVKEAARVLKIGGTLAILNFSYRNDAAADRADIGRLADEVGFEVIDNGTRPFTLWDGVTFLLRKRSL